MVLNLRCVLLCFQAVSGLNINLEKFEMVRIGDRVDEDIFASLLVVERLSFL